MIGTAKNLARQNSDRLEVDATPGFFPVTVASRFKTFRTTEFNRFTGFFNNGRQVGGNG